MDIRDRYAPSPTGLQHIGGIRTALFNYLFAKAKNGTFVLRLEDTDRSRYDDVFTDNLYDTFKWLNFSWDEGPDIGGPYKPYIQSERVALYKAYAEKLVESGRAYYCFCSSERLDALRKEKEAAHSPETGYDRLCGNIDRTEAAARAKKEAHTIRLKIPLGETTRFTDILLGEIEWKNDDINPDPVLLKSDGFPTYHLANIVDDHLMNITHVLRAQEWLSSTPMHVILYKAFGWEAPAFCHLPMVMGQDGKKLSKRHGATSINEFRKNGYLPEALINYIALLGASYEEGKEIYTLKDLAERFSLDKLNKAPAIFDYKKLEWYNAQYIKMSSDENLAALALPFAIEMNLFGSGALGPTEKQKELFIKAMPLVKERALLLPEIPQKIAYLFSAPVPAPPDEFIPKKSNLASAIKLLQMGSDIIQEMAEEDDEGAEKIAKAKAEKEGVKLGDLLMPLRVAITGGRVSPPLFLSVRLLGADICGQRIQYSLESLRKEKV
ncbi:MAG: glutamate--tRNA ligase [Spirochaetaceae bacterium]|jgi:glutamyl-tRNA synthetase|nr:glutamate--tRNA ligase [Spirochaetaceae bacterium]